MIVYESFITAIQYVRNNGKDERGKKRNIMKSTYLADSNICIRLRDLHTSHEYRVKMRIRSSYADRECLRTR